MRTMLLSAILLTSLSAAAMQGAREGHKSLEERMAEKVQYLGIILDLTVDQKESFKDIQALHLEAIDDIQAEYKPVLDAMKAELKTVREKSEGNMEGSKEEAKAIRARYEPQLSGMHDGMKAQKEALEASLSSILTAAQNEKLTQLKAFREEHAPMKGRQGNPNCGPKGPKQENGRPPHPEH